MHVRTTAATAALLLTALTACGGEDDGGSETTASEAAPSQSVDCTDQTMDQAEWMKHCADEASQDEDDGAKSAGLKFGETYTWPDRLEVSVVEAKAWTKFTDDDYATNDPDETEFRVLLKLENTGQEPVALDEVSTFIEGATNGGEAATTEFATDSEPLGGRLAPGVEVTKTDDNVLETKYGKKIVVIVQRNSENFDLDFPEFNGEISG